MLCVDFYQNKQTKQKQQKKKKKKKKKNNHPLWCFDCQNMRASDQNQNSLLVNSLCRLENLHADRTTVCFKP